MVERSSKGSMRTEYNMCVVTQQILLERSGQLQIRGCGGNSCESVAGDRSRAEVSPHTLVPTVKNVICIY